MALVRAAGLHISASQPKAKKADSLQVIGRSNSSIDTISQSRRCFSTVANIIPENLVFGVVVTQTVVLPLAKGLRLSQRLIAPLT